MIILEQTGCIQKNRGLITIMIDKKEAEDILVEIEYACDRTDRIQILQRLYRKGYVDGCNDSGNKVKE